MRIQEILRIPDQDFPEYKVKQLLQHSTDIIGEIDGLYINYIEYNSERLFILTGEHKQIAAYAGFISRLNGKVWQAKNIQTYGEFRGKKLSVKIYKYIKEVLKKSIQSDVEQSDSAKVLWTKLLPDAGMIPKIFDTESEYIIDQTYPEKYKEALQKMYTYDYDDPEKFKYCWILEKYDHYQEQNILTESKLLLPTTGFWYNFK